MFNYFRLVKYYLCKKYDLFQSLKLARDVDIYLFNLDLFEKNILKYKKKIK